MHPNTGNILAFEFCSCLLDKQRDDTATVLRKVTATRDMNPTGCADSRGPFPDELVKRETLANIVEPLLSRGKVRQMDIGRLARDVLREERAAHSHMQSTTINLIYNTFKT